MSVKCQADVDLLVAEGIVRFKMFKAANPVGNDNQKNVFKKSVANRVSGGLRLGLVIQAFRCVLSQPDPWAAIAARPPKPAKSSSVGASASASASVGAVTPLGVDLAFPPLFRGNIGGCGLSRDLVSGFGWRFIFCLYLSVLLFILVIF